MPKISVIIPAYDVAQYIGETLESVFAQTFGDYEVIVVNDGSPDTGGLERALEPFKERIRYFKQENRGAGAARNAGLRASRGEFVAFLDGDDLWQTNYLEEQLEFIEKENCGLVCADAVHFGDSPFDGRTYMEVLMPGCPTSGPITFTGLVSDEQSLITSGVLARRELLFDTGLFDETLRNAQDFDLWIRLILRGVSIAYQRKVLAKYRCREGSLSGDAINRARRELHVFQNMLTRYDLSNDQRMQVEHAISRSEQGLNLVKGKEYLSRGEFDQALEFLARANASQPSWKLKLVCRFLSTAPNLTRGLNNLVIRWRSSFLARRLQRFRFMPKSI